MKVRLPTKIFVLLVLIGLFAVPSAAQGRSVALGTAPTLVHPGFLTVGSDTTYPPMESKDPKSQRAVGADVDLANALAHAMGLRGAIIQTTAFDSIIPSLQRHNFDIIMSSMSDTPVRRKQINFIDYMRLRAGEAILVPRSSSIRANGFAGLCGHSVAVQSGTIELDGLNAQNKHCSSKITIKQYTADTDAFQALASGHADAYITDYPVALYYAKQYSRAVRFAGSAFGTGGYYGIGLLKGARNLYTKVNEALGTIRRNGQYRRILRRYGLGATAI